MPKRVTNEQLDNIALAHGVRLDRWQPDRFSGEIIATAPEGYRFKDCDVHEVVAEYGPGLTCANAAEARSKTYGDIDGGIEKCPDPDCEWCERGGEC